MLAFPPPSCFLFRLESYSIKRRTKRSRIHCSLLIIDSKKRKQIMPQTLDQQEQIHLRQTITSQCVWSDKYRSMKEILQQTANQLPLLISFGDNQTILFFDRNVSNKLFFSPLKQSDDQPDQFIVSPRHCTFAITDAFHGVLEFIQDGQRHTRIFRTLEKLTTFATTNQYAVLFMSRDRIRGHYTDETSSRWLSKEYPQGSLFIAQRIHQHPSKRGNHLECLDEEGYTIFFKMYASGRFSLIANSIEQQENHPEIFLHFTQTTNIDQLIRRLTSENPTKNCLRLVRGDVPHNFHCQYLQFLRRHTHDVLVGVSDEGLPIEWNLDSEASCRYAKNLNDILHRMSDSWEEQLLEHYIDQARTHYRENFQINMQLISTKDWTAFFQYWKWTGEVESIDQRTSYQSRHRFHLLASIQVSAVGNMSFFVY